MKKIINTLATLALALSFGVPTFAATAARPQAQVKTTAVKSPAKGKKTVKKSKLARRAAPANTKTATPQTK